MTEEERISDVEANEDAEFNTLTKKKKKVSASALNGANVAPGSNGPDLGADGADEFSGLKKKKKPSKKISFADDENSEPTNAAGGDEDLFDLKDLKRKKRSRQDMAAFEAELRADGINTGAGASDLDDDGVIWKDLPEEERVWQDTDRDYTYEELLARAFRLLRKNNPELVGEKRRYVIAPPQVIREGSKKSVFANIVDICRKLHRQPEHLKSFLLAELGTSGSVDGTQRLVIKGRYQQKQIENVLRRYIVEYVTCKTCKNPDTILVRENRLYFMQCNACGSSRSVAPIQKGFKAQTESRKSQRAKAT